MIAFSIFGINVYRYGIFYLIGFILAYCFLYFIGRKKYFHKYPKLQNLLENDLETLFIILILGVLIGGRLGHVLIYDFQYFLNNLADIFKIWQGGMSFIGGILGVVLGVSIFIWKKRFSRKEFIILLDLLACILPLCIAFGRLGNFLNQELYGVVFSNSFGRSEGVVGTLTSLGFLHIYDKIDGALRINTNLLSIIFEGVLLFATLILVFVFQIRKKERKIGKISMIFLLRYSLVRFILEYLRQDSQSEFIGPFTRSQRFFVIFISLGIIGTVFMIRHRKESLENKKKSDD